MYELVLLSDDVAISHVKDLQREAAIERQALRVARQAPKVGRNLASQVRCSILEFVGVDEC